MWFNIQLTGFQRERTVLLWLLFSFLKIVVLINKSPLSNEWYKTLIVWAKMKISKFVTLYYLCLYFKPYVHLVYQCKHLCKHASICNLVLFHVFNYFDFKDCRIHLFTPTLIPKHSTNPKPQIYNHFIFNTIYSFVNWTNSC